MIDTSVIIAVVASEAQRAILVEMTKDVALVAPASVHWEAGNALSALLKRRRATLPQAIEALDAYGRIPTGFVAVDSAAALDLCDRLGIYAYDAHLIVCAQAQSCALLTLDHGLSRAARSVGVEIAKASS